jgi:antitoxin CcdA
MKYNPLYDTRAPKKAVNLSINCDLLHKARLNKINLSHTLEERLIELLNEAQKKNWLEKNRDAIDAYNKRVEHESK